MARVRKGRPISGWVVVDKPTGIGSTAVVGKVRWAFDAQKAGHSGTLDPDATGVLAIALGEATKVVPHVTDALKAYEFRVAFGAMTATDDASGAVLARSNIRPDPEMIAQALSRFRGQIMQVPPQVSAVKVAGERAYTLAREGKELTLAPRPLWVDELEITGHPDADHVDLRMVCGKGGYVRAIARDLGQVLGCYGHVVWLRRIWSGPFDLGDAVSLDQIDALAKCAEIDQFLLPLEKGLEALPEVQTSPEGAARLRYGNPGFVIACGLEWGTPAWASFEGKAIAIGHYQAGQLHPQRVLNR